MEKANNSKFQKRNPAVKVSINDILSGKFVKDDLNLSYVQTPYGEKVSRANIVCSVLGKDYSSSAIYVDDGTGKIIVRSFDRPEIFDKADVGDIVMVVGKPREFNNEFYVSIEILKKLHAKWAEVRKLELKQKYKGLNAKAEKIENVENIELKKSFQAFQAKNIVNIVELVRELDHGAGVEILELVSKNNLSEEETKGRIESLLKKGDLFELRPGVVKVLE